MLLKGILRPIYQMLFRTTIHHTGNYIDRTTEMNSACLGIQKGSFTMCTCKILFWSMVIPIVTYASELWILKQQDMEILDEFQSFPGRRIQRFSNPFGLLNDVQQELAPPG